MPLTSTITSYNPLWPDCFLQEAERVTSVFSDALAEIFHVGSTAIPGIAAKPEIDILVVVDDTSNADTWTNGLAEQGYTRGGDLSPGHLFYKRNVEGVRTHKIHVRIRKIQKRLGNPDWENAMEPWFPKPKRMRWKRTGE